MKLVFAIVQNEDGQRVTDALNEKGFSVTRLATTGGFLRSGNTTLLTGVEESKVEEVIAIVKKESRSRKKTITPPPTQGNTPGAYMMYPVEVTVGGATIFVMDVDRFEKV